MHNKNNIDGETKKNNVTLFTSNHINNSKTIVPNNTLIEMALHYCIKL